MIKYFYLSIFGFLNKGEDLYGLILLWMYSMYYFFFFSEVVNPRAFEIVLLVLSFVYFVVNSAGLVKTFPVVFSLIFVFFVYFGDWFYSSGYSEMGNNFMGVRELLGFLAFLPLAVIIKGRGERVVALYLSAGLGLLIAPWINGGWISIYEGVSGQRVWLAGLNPIMVAINSSVFVVLLLCMCYIIKKNRRHIALLGLTLLGSVFLLYIYVSQSRSAYIGLFFVLIWFLFIFFILGRKNSFIRKNKSWLALLLVCSAIVLIYLAVTSGMIEKTKREYATFNAVLSLDFEAVPDTSWGYRVQMLAAGVEYMAKRPLVGWGYEGGSKVIELVRLGDPDKNFSHLHNSYLEYAVSYGVVSAAAYILFAGWILFILNKNIWVLLDRYPYFFFLPFAMIFYVVVSNFDIVQTHSTTSRLYTLTLGASVSIIWYGLTDTIKKGESV